MPGLRLGGPPRLATLRVYDQVVAAVSLPCIIEPVRYVRLEVQSVTFLQQVLLIQFVTATATNGDGDTSEFSVPKRVVRQ